MAQITAALVKELRDKSGAGMMDCKKALSENDGNLEAAVDWLRTKGLAAAAKKSSRVAAEGLVAVKVDGNKGVAVEVNSETDFVARNEQFQAFVAGVAAVAFDAGEDVDAIKAATFPGASKTVEETLTENVATIGENQSIRRVQTLEVESGAVISYIHNAVATDMGKIAVLVGLKSDAGADALAPLGKQLAMHIAATNPICVDEDGVPAETLERERRIFAEQAAESGKPPEIVEKMVTGRVAKFLKEITLLGQPVVKDPDVSVGKLLKSADATVNTFVRYEVGEGIEKKQENIAEEVLNQISQA